MVDSHCYVSLPEGNLPTINFQVRTVSFREGSNKIKHSDLTIYISSYTIMNIYENSQKLLLHITTMVDSTASDSFVVTLGWLK